jgi:hypothetical protein
LGGVVGSKNEHKSNAHQYNVHSFFRNHCAVLNILYIT